MDDVLRNASEILRWFTPVFGVTISVLALRRFGANGIGLAVAGFGLMLLGPLTRTLIWVIRTQNTEFNARDYVFVSGITGIATVLGFVFVLLSLRRLIQAARRLERGQGGAE